MSIPVKTSYGTAWVNNEDDMLLHREEGPAVELNNGRALFYIHGGQVSFDDWSRLTKADSKTVTFWRLKLAGT